MMNRRFLGLTGIVALVTLSSLTGCAPATTDVKVTGHVALDGVPIEQGAITFLAEANDGPSGGGTITNGKYEAIVPPGKKIVMVIGSKVVGERLRLEGVKDSGTIEDVKTITNPVYNTREHSPLRADITGPANDINFNLTADGKGS